jgi:hypothetical protein
LPRAWANRHAKSTSRNTTFAPPASLCSSLRTGACWSRPVAISDGGSPPRRCIGPGARLHAGAFLSYRNYRSGSKSDGAEQPVAGRGEADGPCGDSGDYQGDQKIPHRASRVQRQSACALEAIVVSRFLPAGRRASFRLIAGRASPSCQCRPTILGGSSGVGG